MLTKQWQQYYSLFLACSGFQTSEMINSKFQKETFNLDFISILYTFKHTQSIKWKECCLYVVMLG